MCECVYVGVYVRVCERVCVYVSVSQSVCERECVYVRVCVSVHVSVLLRACASACGGGRRLSVYTLHRPPRM